MYLKSLELAGFKSFAKKSNLYFSSRITSIVGPNGSGKSNISEAFRFVLGEQSIKSMRGKRGEDLIFNGGHDAQRQNRAYVKVVFDNTNRVLNIDFDEVTIERVVHRDSSNEYLINGTQVRLKDITELLSGAHIGPSGHHIISQGEADKILNTNIKERREMIEDALGLKIYQYKKQESIRKLQKTEENIKQVESLRKEIAPHLKFLKKQVEKIEKLFEMKKEIRVLYREYFKREDIYLKTTRANIESKIDLPNKELKRLENELSVAKSILENAINKDEKSTEIISLEDGISKARNERDTLTRQIGNIEGEISSLLRLLQKEKSKQKEDDHKMVSLKEIETLVYNVEREIDSVAEKDDISSFKSVLLAIKDICIGFVRKNKTAEVVDNTKELDLEIKRLQNDKNIHEQSLLKIIEKENSLKIAYERLKNDIEKEKDSNRDAEKNVFKIVARQNEIQAFLNSLKGEMQKLQIEEESFKRELGEAHILAGRDAVDYPSHILQNESGEILGNEFVVSEPRNMQEERRKYIERIKMRIEDSGGGNSEEVMREHREVEERDAFLMKELEDLIKSGESLKLMIAELDVRLDKEFKEGILKINAQFNEFFALMFGGGNASLSIIRENKKKRKDDTLLLDDQAISNEIEEEKEGSEGVEISVDLPRKKVKNLEMLSGGERALTSIALLFAISQVNPPPFIILDETDAALDEANSRKYGDMIENLAKYSQLILITHNRETMSRAGSLYGVTMGNDGSSKLLSVAFDEAVKVAK